MEWIHWKMLKELRAKLSGPEENRRTYSMLWIPCAFTTNNELHETNNICCLQPIIAISKLDAVWLCHSWVRRMFSGGKFTEVSVCKADCRGDFVFNTITWVSQNFLLVTDRQKCEEESVGQTGGQIGWQTLLHVCLRYFFPHIGCQTQIQLLYYFCLVM